ncbi:1bec60db-e3ce-4f37-b6fc-ece6d3c9c4dd [Sclerotinia trifoliorum]|uniref:1bec60db-e3ce-4f37-b6fc-ece6d3c9c4dd n=1 Tax=Sclerotinia trifoliorum TaxID=28548 RepID=A0A8H2VZ39_9HELO|nr:1bec60db-e3ce-4f37-b6fc-ece6d3c9c4dd [Sclerotinia trifoliorum]
MTQQTPTPDLTPKPPIDILNTTWTTITTTMPSRSLSSSTSPSPSPSPFVSGSQSRSLPANVVFAPSTLYIFLADIGHDSLISAYFASSPPTSIPFLAPVTGTIFHITNPTGPWTYQSHTLPLTHLSKFIPTLLFILKLCPIDIILHQALSSRLSILGLETQLLSSMPSGSPPISTPDTQDSIPTSTSSLKETENEKDENEKEKEKEIETKQEITTQTWITQTLQILEEEGYISFPENLRLSSKLVVECIESEAVAGAGWHRMRGTVGWERSAWVGE